MLKRISLLVLIFSGLSFSALAADPFHLSGTYQCVGYDQHDGFYQQAKLTLTLDQRNSDFAHAYGSYHFKLVEQDGGGFLGEAVASGNTMAVYFSNPKDLSDSGVGLATISNDVDAKGQTTTVFHKFYYEPGYTKKGNRGYETCVKN